MLSIGESFLGFLILIIFGIFLVQAFSKDKRDSDYSNTCLVFFSDVLSLGNITLKITLSSLIVVLLWGFSFLLYCFSGFLCFQVHNRFRCSCFEPITRAIGTSTVGHLNLHNRRAFLLIVANTCSNPYSGV